MSSSRNVSIRLLERAAIFRVMARVYVGEDDMVAGSDKKDLNNWSELKREEAKILRLFEYNTVHV
jgi:hypothetical protein